MDSAPNDVKDSEELQYEIEKQNGLDIKHKNEKWRNKVGKLKDAGGFRIPRPKQPWERIDNPKFEGQVHEIPVTDAFKGANVEDTKGNTYPVKTSLAVPRGSADVDLGDAGPGQGRRAKQREMLQDFARDLFFLITPEGLTLARVAQLLNSMGGFQDTTDVYGPAKAGRIVNFLKLFPKQFRLEGTGARIKVFEAPPAPRAPRVQEGGASSSTDPAPPQDLMQEGPRQRVRTGTNTPSRLFPDNLRVEYGPNPIKPGTARYNRYERYKNSTTIGEAKRKGALSSDIGKDIDRGVLRIL